jgi:hypothetical protein
MDATPRTDERRDALVNKAWSRHLLIASAQLHRRPLAIAAAAALLAGAALSLPARGENAEITLRRAAERTTFSDDEIRDGFFKTAFHGELQFDAPTERIRKFDRPVRIYIDNRGTPDRRADVAAVVEDIRAHIAHLDLAVTADRNAANFLVMLVPRRELAPVIRARYGAERARKIERKLAPECLSGIAKDASFRIRRAEAILPVDAGEFFFYDCAYEELLQGLGIINDDNSVPWTMFNDDVQMGFFDTYDQYLVNILYDSRLRPGMTKAEVDSLLPEVLPTVRAWVANAKARMGAESGTGSRAGLNAGQAQ